MITRTNIRMLSVTITFPLLVHGLMCQSVTGVTGLTSLDRLTAPYTQADTQQWAFAVVPAPFAEPSLSTLTAARIIVPWDLLVALRGTASDRWFDLSTLLARSWLITDRFSVGTVVDVGASRAAGFVLNTHAAMGIQSRILVDTHWTVGVGVSNLLAVSSVRTWQPRRLSIGVGYHDDVSVAADVITGTNQRTALVISALMQPHEIVVIRSRIVSEPLSIGADARITTSTDMYISVMYDLVFDIGHRLGIVLELS